MINYFRAMHLKGQLSWSLWHKTWLDTKDFNGVKKKSPTRAFDLLPRCSFSAQEFGRCCVLNIERTWKSSSELIGVTVKRITDNTARSPDMSLFGYIFKSMVRLKITRLENHVELSPLVYANFMAERSSHLKDLKDHRRTFNNTSDMLCFHGTIQ